mmetsp:Transcript_43272/g.41651  ORF Transcript_43272/g.41651 Transcript_43272/m.41651 type:complete len:133 (+) Transcript_43272:964-1362(+)
MLLGVGSKLFLVGFLHLLDDVVVLLVVVHLLPKVLDPLLELLLSVHHLQLVLVHLLRVLLLHLALFILYPSLVLFELTLSVFPLLDMLLFNFFQLIFDVVCFLLLFESFLLTVNDTISVLQDRFYFLLIGIA